MDRWENMCWITTTTKDQLTCAELKASSRQHSHIIITGAITRLRTIRGSRTDRWTVSTTGWIEAERKKKMTAGPQGPANIFFVQSQYHSIWSRVNSCTGIIINRNEVINYAEKRYSR